MRLHMILKRRFFWSLAFVRVAAVVATLVSKFPFYGNNAWQPVLSEVEGSHTSTFKTILGLLLLFLTSADPAAFYENAIWYGLTPKGTINSE